MRLWVAILLSASMLHGQQASFPDIKDWKSLRISLSRGPCFGQCPVYTVEVDGDGTVRYKGTYAVGVLGERQDRISPADVMLLFGEFRKADYFTLKEQLCRAPLDHPNHTITLAYDRFATKKVVDGCVDRSGEMAVVTELEAAIDKYAGVARWVSRR
jgi:hypothetical protein